MLFFMFVCFLLFLLSLFYFFSFLGNYRSFKSAPNEIHAIKFKKRWRKIIEIYRRIPEYIFVIGNFSSKFLCFLSFLLGATAFSFVALTFCYRSRRAENCELWKLTRGGCKLLPSNFHLIVIFILTVSYIM